METVACDAGIEYPFSQAGVQKLVFFRRRRSINGQSLSGEFQYLVVIERGAVEFNKISRDSDLLVIRPEKAEDTESIRIFPATLVSE
jgi:hypothetical protein